MRTVFRAHACVRLGGRPVADEIDLPARGIASVQSALRSAQNLDSIHVEQLTRRLDGEREGNSLEAHADGRGIVRGIVEKPDAANSKLRLAAAERGFDLQTG